MTDYKKYSLRQLENFMYDAMGAGEASPQEIYDVIVSVVKDNYYTYKKQSSEAYELLGLLNGNGNDHISGYDDTELMPNLQYTDEELDGMCDTAEAKERESNFPEKEDRPKTWILPVDDEGVIILPEDLLERTGWKEGDTLVYEISDGGVIVRKKEPMTHNEMIAAGYTMTDDGFWILTQEGC